MLLVHRVLTWHFGTDRESVEGSQKQKVVSLSTTESEIMSYTKVSQAANLPEGTVWHSDCRLFGIQIAAAVFGDDG